MARETLEGWYASQEFSSPRILTRALQRASGCQTDTLGLSSGGRRGRAVSGWVVMMAMCVGDEMKKGGLVARRAVLLEKQCQASCSRDRSRVSWCPHLRVQQCLDGLIGTVSHRGQTQCRVTHRCSISSTRHLCGKSEVATKVREGGSRQHRL